MSASPRLRLLLLLPLLLLATACSMVNVAYNNADSALRWRAGDYFEFEPEQWTLFGQGLKRVHTWHRRAELPQYAALCDEAAARVEAGLKAADLDWAEAALRGRYAVLVEHSAGDLAAVLATLKPEQLPAIDAKFLRVNEKFHDEHLAGSVTERERKRVREALKKLEGWVGELDAAQTERLRALLAALPQSSAQRHQHRQKRQQELRSLLAAQLPPERLAPALRQWLLAWESGRSAEHERLSKQWRLQGRQLLLELDAMLTPAQRAHLAAELRRYASEFRALSGARA